MMGNDFFGLTKRPFFAEPIPEMYCPFGSTEAARVEISRCVERLEGIALVAGLAGTGKTLLCRKLQLHFGRKMQTILLNGKNLNHPKTFFDSVLSRLNIPFDPRSLGAMRDSLNAALETSSRFHTGILLLIDDAQATGIRVFEEIRQLLDRTVKPEWGVRVVLFGDMSLEEKLGFPQLNSFSQRITTRCFLATMNRDETVKFLLTELKQAGAKKEIFSRDVCREIHRFSEGVPRVTNQLADILLLVAEEELKNSAKEKKDSASNSNAEDGKNAELDFEPTFPGDASGVDIFVDPDETIQGFGKKLKNEPSRKKERDQEITVAMVRKAWCRLQQLPEEIGAEAGSIAKAEADTVTAGKTASSSIPVSGNSTKEKSNSGSSIEFGSLDDDLDSENAIDLGGEQVDDPTIIWSYDEMEDVRNAVEAANTILEKRSASIKENAVKEEEREKNVPLAAETPNIPLQKTESQPEYKSRNSERAQSPCEIPTGKENIQPRVSPAGKESAENDDLWDVYREQSNIRFPERKGTQWITPSYSSGTPDYTGGGNSSDSNSIQSAHGGTMPPVRRLNDVSNGTYGVNYLSVPSVCPRTVDELIYNAVMEDTVHSMGLLRNILCALQGEKQKKDASQPLDEYWFTLYDSTKGLMRQIAHDRLNRAAQAPAKDFYNPESLVEKDAYSPVPDHSGSSGISNPISRPFNQEPVQVSQPIRGSDEIHRQGNSFEESPEMREIAELRKLLQECRGQNNLDTNVQDKILDIIDRLQMLNQYN